MKTMTVMDQIIKSFDDTVVQTVESVAFPHIEVRSNSLKELMSFCLYNADMRFDYLNCMTAVDTEDVFEVIYHLYSTIFSHKLNVKVIIDRKNPKIDSVTGFWKAAYYYELEAAEMFGIFFNGHPSPGKRLLLPEEWSGFPLRKDYEFPQRFGEVEHKRDPLLKEHPRSE